MLFLRLIVSHLIVDFVLQPKGWVLDKQKNKIRSIKLYFHGMLSGVLAYLFVADWGKWWVIFVVGLTHVVIDVWKTYQKEGIRSFVTDQILHFIVLLFVWQFLTETSSIGSYLHHLLNSLDAWAVTAGYIFVIWPAGLLIAYYTKNWKNEINDNGLYEAGKTIGQLERILILTFVIIGRYEAIGFLIAAKSVFRFNQIQENKERKVGEYILIGTMLSFAISIGVGLMITLLLNYSEV